MSKVKHVLRFAAVWFALAMVAGCESTGGGSSSASVGVYYGVGFYDPWYYGGYHDHDYDIDITPPNRPDRPDRPVRPEQPITQPRTSSQRSTPSIPSTPQPAFRGGGGGGGRR
jgi:hypothetical protein